jgi:hypothetical protein
MFENATMKAFERGEEGKWWGGKGVRRDEGKGERGLLSACIRVSQWNLFEQIRYDNENYHFS